MRLDYNSTSIVATLKLKDFLNAIKTKLVKCSGNFVFCVIRNSSNFLPF